jgi:hypothetical protein
MANKLRRIEIGFDGGQVVAVRVLEDELASLHKALDKGGWHSLTTEEDTVDLYVGKIVFIRTAGDGTKVGF